MFERCVDEAERVLSSKKDSVASVKEVWEEVTRRAKKEGFAGCTLADFTTMLDGDERFEIIPAAAEPEDADELSGEDGLDAGDLESLGFYSEDRVRLRTIPAQAGSRTAEEEEEVGSIRRKSFATPPPKKEKAERSERPGKRKPVKRKSAGSKRNSPKKSPRRKTSRTRKPSPRSTRRKSK